MLPADGILQAAARWLDLLPRATVDEAGELIRQDAAYADLTNTQYASGLAWLREIGLVSGERNYLPLAAGQRAELLFRASLAADEPAWLEDADGLIEAIDDMPSDALALAGALGLSDAEALAGIRQVHGKLDLARRNEVGVLGERLLVDLLETQWPGCARHVSSEDDSLGYDIVLEIGGTAWKLEVKSTTRRNRLRVFVSRNELAVGSLLPDWRLVIVGISSSENIEAIATMRVPYLTSVAPQNKSAVSRWESASFDLAPERLDAGLSFLQADEVAGAAQVLERGRAGEESSFSWMPAQ